MPTAPLVGLLDTDGEVAYHLDRLEEFSPASSPDLNDPLTWLLYRGSEGAHQVRD